MGASRWIYRSVWLLVLIGFLSGCGVILRKNYGYHDPADFNETAYRSFISSLDTARFSHMQSTTQQFEQYNALVSDSARKKDLSQPVQILYFSGADLVAYHANCYAKGSLSGIDWNWNRAFDRFPPGTAIEPALFGLDLPELRAIYGEVEPTRSYTVVVFWSWMVEEVSRDAVETVIASIDNSGNSERCSIVLVNSDAFWRATMGEK
jgi:hypothetical protein